MPLKTPEQLEDFQCNDTVISNYCGYGIDALNISIANELVKNLATYTQRKGKPKCDVVVNLTSFPARIHEVHYSLLSILSQSLLPKRINLWLSLEEFPLGLDSLPETLLKMVDLGVFIKWTENLKCYNKLIPALINYPNAIHITADDDVFYGVDWLKELFEEYTLYGDEFIYAHRAHRIHYNQFGFENYDSWDREIPYGSPSFLNVATGVGGVLYPPSSLLPHAINSGAFMSLSPTNDDLWYWVMALLNDKKIRVTKNRRKLVYINPMRELRLNDEFTLSRENVVNLANDHQLENLFRLYPEILTKLNNETASYSTNFELNK
jgi:hypothetical protein